MILVREERLYGKVARHLGGIFRLRKRLLRDYFEKVGREGDI